MSTKSQTRPGTNTQLTRQSFITAELAKVGSMEALGTKYGIGGSIIESWIKGTAQKDTIELLIEVHAASTDNDHKQYIGEQICRISQALERLDKDYKEGDD